MTVSTSPECVPPIGIKEEMKEKEACAKMPPPPPRAPAESGGYHYLNHRGHLSFTAYSLPTLRSIAAKGDIPVFGSSICREDDNLWLPLQKVQVFPHPWNGLFLFVCCFCSFSLDQVVSFVSVDVLSAVMKPAAFVWC